MVAVVNADLWLLPQIAGLALLIGGGAGDSTNCSMLSNSDRNRCLSVQPVARASRGAETLGFSAAFSEGGVAN